jgi:RNA polymerase sigma factor (sigma-70 family)
MNTRAGGNSQKVTQKLIEGDREILNRLTRTVRAFNGRPDPDLEQEAFLNVLRAFLRTRHVEFPHALMRKIVRDTVVDAWRRRAPETVGLETLHPGNAGPEDPQPEDLLDQQRSRTRLRESILRLNSDTRAPVYLFYVESYPIRTIGRLLGRSPSAVKMALYRGRARIFRELTRSRKLIRSRGRVRKGL